MSLLKLNRLIQPMDYGILLPFLARLPISWGYRGAQLRGAVHALLDYDWRSNTLDLRYVRERVMAVMDQFSPSHPMLGTLRRFQHYAVEEWQGHLFSDPLKMELLGRQSRIDHVDAYRKALDRRQGIVLVSAHYDSFCMGIVLYGMQGLSIHAVKNAGMEDPRIDPMVRAHFRKKYATMEPLMGGAIHHHEGGGMAFFHERLNRGEMVLIMGDLPGSRSTIRIEFLGKSFCMPLGAWHMARRTGSLLGAFVTLSFPGGRFHTVAIPPYAADPHDPKASMEPIYRFLEQWIMAHPEKWLASDLLEGY